MSVMSRFMGKQARLLITTNDDKRVHYYGVAKQLCTNDSIGTWILKC